MPSAYLQSARHPWPTLLFLGPLLGAYEGGLFWLGGHRADTFRNGADAWIRWGLQSAGLKHDAIAPAVIAAFFVAWAFLRRGDRPKDMIGTIFGMGIETVFFALGLWALSRALVPLLERTGFPLAWPPLPEEAVGQAVTFLGAGIYEEVLFRLVLFAGLSRLMGLALLPKLFSLPLAAVGSSVLFAGAHHVGSVGEPFVPYVFLFRVVAGLYFAAVFQYRGVGVAAAAHALYDVIVGANTG